MRYVHLSAIYHTDRLYYTGDIVQMLKNQQEGDWREYLRTYDLWWQLCHWDLDENSVVLDIGAGCGITSLWLQKKYGCRIILLDTDTKLDQVQQPLWGWHASETNCLSVVEKFWRCNGAEFEFQNAHNVDWSSIPDLDLVISKSSWGVHYHIDTYFEQVHQRQPRYMYVNWRSISKQHGLFLRNGYGITPVGPADYVNKTWLYRVYVTQKSY